MKNYLIALLFLITSPAVLSQANNDTVLVSGEAVLIGNQLRSASQNSTPLDHLKNLLNLAREKQDMSYAGVAIASIEKLADTEKQQADIKILYADLLQFTHQFPEAINHYQELLKNSDYHDQALLKLTPLYMLTGQYNQASMNCQDIGSAINYQVGLVCRLWLNGVTSNLNQAIDKLIALRSLSSNDSSLDAWIQSIIIDLYLQAGEFDRAIVAFDQYQETFPTEDDAIKKLLIDYLLIHNRSEEVLSLTQKITPENPLYLRVLMAKAIHNKDMVAKENIQSIINEIIDLKQEDRYVDVAMWHLLIEQNAEQALQYSQANWNKNRDVFDLLLLHQAAQKSGDKNSKELVAQWAKQHNIQTTLLKI